MDRYLISVENGIAVAVTAAGLYIVFVLVLRIVGQRVLAAMSSLDVLVVITMGAVIGRAILGASPDLAGGVIALLSLFAIQATFSQARRWRFTAQLFRNPPLALIVDGEPVEKNLRRAHLHPDEVWARLRVAGVPGPHVVRALVLESTGQLSVVRVDEQLDPRMLRGVVGIDENA